ncbi:hypothetical protein [Sphingobacterium siyangense]|uniref:hypothetical protein n=1 Tax=Sphingobacterium siyangense TaxID=459529 RepID=UPI002FD8BB9E
MRIVSFYFIFLITLLSCNKEDIVGGTMSVTGGYNIKIVDNGENISSYYEKDVQLFFRDDKGTEILYYNSNLQSPYGINYYDTKDPYLNIIAFDLSKTDSLIQNSTKQEQIHKSDMVLKYFDKALKIQSQIAYTNTYIVINEIIINGKKLYDRYTNKQETILIDYKSL